LTERESQRAQVEGMAEDGEAGSQLSRELNGCEAQSQDPGIMT